MTKQRKSRLKIVLLAMLIVAFGYAFYIQMQISGLERQRKVLLEELGDFRNTDVNKIHLLQLDTNDPYRFKWRFVLPGNQIFDGFFECERNWNSMPMQTYTRQKRTNRRIAILFEFGGKDSGLHLTGAQSAKYPFSNGQGIKLANFLREHWRELRIETAGNEEITEYAPDKAVEVFALWIPPELMDAFEQEFTGRIVKQAKAGPLFRYSIRSRNLR